jgi:hypothetical protein
MSFELHQRKRQVALQLERYRQKLVLRPLGNGLRWHTRALKASKVCPRIWDVGQDQIMQGDLINWHEGKRERHEISCSVRITLPRSYDTSSTRKGRGKLASRWGE